MIEFSELTDEEFLYSLRYINGSKEAFEKLRSLLEARGIFGEEE